MPLVIPMPAGKMLSSDGVTWIDKYPPGYTLATDLGRAYTGDGATTPETSLLVGGAALSSLIPAAVAIGDSALIQLRGTFLNTVTGTLKSTVNVYWGAYQLVSIQSVALTANAAVRVWGMDIKAVVEVVGGANTGKVRLLGQRWGFAGLANPGTGWATLASATLSLEINDGASSGTNANLITNAAGNFNVTATHTTSATTLTTALNLAQVLWLPKNY